MNMRKTFLLSSASALLIVFLFTMAVVLNAQWLTHLDQLFIQYRLPDILAVTTFVGVIAKFATIGPILVVFCLISIFLLRSNFKTLTIWCLGNLILISGIGYLLKQLIQRSRPDQIQYISRSSYSFPSGHSLLVMTFVCSVLLIYFFIEKKPPLIIKSLLIFLLITITGGRIYLGVHFFSDIIAGLFLGGGITFGTASLFYPYLRQKSSVQDRKVKFMTWQKVLLSILAMLVVLAAGVSVFALKVYQGSQKMADSMYSPIEREKKQKSLAASEPISILILGIANDAKRKTDFRANTIMVATLNNQLNKATLVSIPRDSFVEIVGADYEDKINHAHSIGGPEMMMDTVEKFLDIPIHHYVAVNMDGLQTLVDAVGGVTVDNDFAFSAEGIDYPKGKQHLNGWEALQYSRMRYEDPTGDYGRQGRQREVMELLINKLLSAKSIFSYQKILDGIGENGKTDLTFHQMQTILTGYHSCLTEIDSQQVQGEGFIGDGFTGEEGISYQKIPQEESDRVKKLLHKQLALEESKQ